MKILWVTNNVLPEASQLMHNEISPIGGWVVNASRLLSEQENIDLSIASPQKGNKKVEIYLGKKIKYFIFSPEKPRKTFANKYNEQLVEILNEMQPDIVHIYGTELAHTLSMVNACIMKEIKVVISIQGLVSFFSYHYMAGLPEKIQKRYTFRDIIRHDNLEQQLKGFERRGELEIAALQKTKHVIGRTDWDKVCTAQINPNLKYHFCNETLREEFYRHQWSLDKCERYSIFVSQATYPIKGLHFLLTAMPLIMKQFPQVKLYVSGEDITKSDSLYQKLKKSSYDKYIIKLIKKYNLGKSIVFTGRLNEQEMCERFLGSNVYVCPSSIENSPNSLGEAMILGLPCVASYVGGIPDMIEHKKDGFLYQVDAPYMLCYYVCEIFDHDDIVRKLSVNARRHALKIFDSDENSKNLIEIYNGILET